MIIRRRNLFSTLLEALLLLAGCVAMSSGESGSAQADAALLKPYAGEPIGTNFWDESGETGGSEGGYSLTFSP